MRDLGQEALEDMNRLLLNQQRLKKKLERMGNYGESATIKRLQEQLKEANELISLLFPLSTNKERAIERTTEYMEKWGVK